MSYPASTLPRTILKDDARNPLWKTTASRMDRAYNQNFEDPVREFSIPRPQPRPSRTSDDLTIINLNKYPRIERYFNGYDSDSSDSTAVAQVTQEFNFLRDEQSTISPVRRTNRLRAQLPSRPDASSLVVDRPVRKMTSSKRETLNRFIAIFSCILQILISIGLLVFAALRYDKLFTRLAGRQLMDHEKTQAELSALFEVRTGTSIFAPAILMLAAGSTGLIAFIRNKTFLYASHAVFAYLAILFWFDAIATISRELNIYYIQKQTIDSSDVSIFIAVTIIVSLDCILLPLLTFIFALRDVAPVNLAHRTWAHVIFAIIAMILAGALLGLAVCCISATMAPIYSSQISLVPMQAYGVIELIIAVFLFVIGLFGVFTALSYSRRLRFISSFLYALSLLAVIINLLSPDRIINVTANLRVIAANDISYPVSFAVYLIINLLSFFTALYLIFLIIFTLYFVYRPKVSAPPPNAINYHRRSTRTVF